MYKYDDPEHPYATSLEELTDSIRTHNLNPQKHELSFLNPIFHNGINITVRNADKWSGIAIGDTLLIKKSSEERVVKTAIVLGKATLPFDLIPENWLSFEHDPRCRTPEGLLEHGMKSAYPDFNGNEVVTVLMFYI